MRHLALLTGILFLVAAFVSPVASARGDVRISYGVFEDTSRDRQIPYKLYAPSRQIGPAPVILFSHGMGGTVETAPYLGMALSGHGYMAFFLQHPGSDQSIWDNVPDPTLPKEELREIYKIPGASFDRNLDIPFVLDELERLNCAGGVFEGLLDLEKIGMAGHSFGAHGVLKIAGERSWLGGQPHKEERIKAALALSPNVNKRFFDLPDSELTGIYDGVEIPILHVTGTEDGYPFNENFDPAQRTRPYRAIEAPAQYLLVLKGAEHSSFGGRTPGDEARMPFWDVTSRAAVLFFDAWLKGDAHAKKSLEEDFPETLSPGDTFEHK